MAEWLPALDGVTAKLTAGATVADVGCGYGASTILMAQAYPRSRFVGSDYHARVHRRSPARAPRTPGSPTACASRSPTRRSYTGRDYDLVTMFDCLHDMGDPVGAARHVHDTLAADGTWMVVEPQAGDRVEDNLNPVGRVYYGFSTLVCTPSSLSQPLGLALGTQAGPARIREVTATAGFTRFRQAAQTPFNMVLEVRPEELGRKHSPRPPSADLTTRELDVLRGPVRRRVQQRGSGSRLWLSTRTIERHLSNICVKLSLSDKSARAAAAAAAAAMTSTGAPLPPPLVIDVVSGSWTNCAGWEQPGTLRTADR